MTAFITHCLRNARLDLLGVLASACLVLGYPGVAQAELPVAEVLGLRIERGGESVLLSANVNFELPVVVSDALVKGVALIFVAEAEVLRERWYWTNKTVVSAERHMRLAYHPLTRRWRLNVASGVITAAGLGVALSQNFDALPDALSAVQRLSRWKIAEVSEIDPDQRHLLSFRFRLDVSQLPRPLQIGTLGQSDWDIFAAVVRPLVLESVK